MLFYIRNVEFLICLKRIFERSLKRVRKVFLMFLLYKKCIVLKFALKVCLKSAEKSFLKYVLIYRIE